MLEEKQHALLSASSAERWLTCTPSARLEMSCQTDEETCSVYAQEGTLAHAIAEVRLSHLYGKVSDDEATEKLSELYKDEMYTDEMSDYVDAHVNYVKSITDNLKEYFIMFEVKLDFSNVVPQGFGTADVLIVTKKDIYVIDLKYGKGVPVSAVNNPQLKLYALGALNLFPASENVYMTINQPRIDNLDETSLTKSDLLAWAIEEVIPKAELAIKGEGVLTPTENACRFCTLKSKCKARADQKMGIIQKDFYIEDAQPKDVATLTDDQIAFVLKVGPSVVDWVKDVQAFALGQMTAGVKIPGYKLVEGRSSRVITDEAEVLKRLIDNGYNQADLMTEPKLLTLTNLEKTVGKKEFNNICADLIEKPHGKLSIAKEDDERPEANTILLDFRN